MNLPSLVPRLIGNKDRIYPQGANIKDEMHALTWLYTNIPDYISVTHFM